MSDHENELPMLAGIGALIHWLEELLNILNGPLLLVGAGIALVDLLTDGALTVSAPILLYAWAISQALGIDTQLLGCFARARGAHAWARVGWLILGVILGFAAWQAGDVFAVQQAQHLSEATALARLGVDPALWLGWRAFLAVGLVALSGWTRYRRPAPVSLGDEREKLERELTLEPLRQRLRMQQVGGFRSLAQTALQGAGVAQNTQTHAQPFEPTDGHVAATLEGAGGSAPAEPESSIGPDRPPTGPGSPALGSNPRKQIAERASAKVTPLRTGMGRPPRRDKRTAARANARSGRKGTAETRIRAILASDPQVDFDELVTRAKVSRSTASKYVALVEAERQAEQNAQQSAQPQRQDGVRYAQ